MHSAVLKDFTIELNTAFQGLRIFLKPVLLLSLVVGLFNIIPIGYMREVYGPVMNSRSEFNLFWVTALLALGLVVAALVHWIRHRVFMSASAKLTALLQRRVFVATFEANLRGVSGARIALSDFRQIKNFLASPAAGYIFEAPVGLFFIGIIFYIHPYMGAMSLFGAFLTVVTMVLTERYVNPILEKATQASQRSQIRLGDYSRNAKVAASMGMLPALRAKWLKEQTEFLRWQAQASNAQGLGAAVSKVVMLVQGSALLGLGTFLSLTGVLSPSAGALLIVAKFLGMLAVQPLMQVIQSWKVIATAKDSYGRLKTFLENVPAPKEGMRLPPPEGFLTVHSAAIRAPGQKATIVGGLDFQVSPGQILAVMGPSGSGKSSLARLVTGLWPPLVGEARLDGVSLFAWPSHELGPYLGFLPQDIELFDGTLAENIERFGESNLEKLRAAIDAAQLQPLVDSLPLGLHTPLGDDAMVLSGGQRQRVGLARALYGDPRLLVLDEPNANLDADGDAALKAALLQAKARGAAIVLMTHRREVLEIADLVLVLADGKQRLFGPRDQVFAQINVARQKHLQSIAAKSAAA